MCIRDSTTSLPRQRLLRCRPEDNEFLHYINEHHTDTPPLAFETEEFFDWFDQLPLLEGHLCIATVWDIHDSYWMSARPDADTVIALPSPRFSTSDVVTQRFHSKRMPLRRWLEAEFSVSL